MNQDDKNISGKFRYITRQRTLSVNILCIYVRSNNSLVKPYGTTENYLYCQFL